MIVNFIKNAALPAIFARLPFGSLQKWAGVIPLIPCYHLVSDDVVLHVKHLYTFKSVKEFKDDLDTLLKRFRPIALHDLLSSLRNAQPLPSNSLLLQFDDGFREQYDVIAPILSAKGISATFFLITSCLDNHGMAHGNKVSLLIEHVARGSTPAQKKQILEVLATRGIRCATVEAALLAVDYFNRDILDTVAGLLDYDFSSYLLKSRPYLTSDEVRGLIRMGFTIGGHSVDHPKYSLIPIEEQIHQTRASMRCLRERFSLSYGAFAFPHGDDNLSERFFKQIFADGDVDASFGNIAVKYIPRSHFARLPMDNEPMPTEKVLGRYYAKSLYDLAIRRRIIEEPKWTRRSAEIVTTC